MHQEFNDSNILNVSTMFKTCTCTLQSCILAEYLLTVEFMNLHSIAAALDLHPHDIPLLLVTTSTSTCTRTCTYACTCRRLPPPTHL